MSRFVKRLGLVSIPAAHVGMIVYHAAAENWPALPALVIVAGVQVALATYLWSEV